MWYAIALTISLHVVYVLGSRSSDILPTCNWVRDEGNGIYPGWYAIDIKTPMNYCNSYNAFNASTLDVTESGSWYYACMIIIYVSLCKGGHTEMPMEGTALQHRQYR
eukprot:212341_1